MAVSHRMLYQCIIRPCLFSLEPESAHHIALRALKTINFVPLAKRFLSRAFSFSHPSLRFDLLGRHFDNPVGLAAGFDKDCEIFNAVSAFGFGFVECGTVTAKAQPGNSKPRLFRLPAEEALINRMGFNNRGAEWAASRLRGNFSATIPVGMNIGKSKVTPLADAVEDYLFTFEKLYPFADYIAVNVSSPNTPNLRELQKDLSPLLSALQKKNSELAQLSKNAPKPLFVKIAPDLSFPDLDNIAECCINHNVSGLIAANTTTSFEGIKIPESLKERIEGDPQAGRGGLSGKPLEKRSTEMVRHIYRKVKNKMVIIGVGGIFSAEDAYRKIKAGASLVQVYTGWIYGGAFTISSINKGLVTLLRRDGFKNIQDAVGVEA